MQFMSVYAVTKRRLLGKGVERMSDGRLALTDKHLFLLFVKLERALGMKDFEVIRSRVLDIENYAVRLGKRQLAVLAYMYVQHHEPALRLTEIELVENGEVVIKNTYRRPVSRDEIAIDEWSWEMGKRYHKRSLRLLYGSDD
jgi:hypothetical protein